MTPTEVAAILGSPQIRDEVRVAPRADLAHRRRVRVRGAVPAGQADGETAAGLGQTLSRRRRSLSLLSGVSTDRPRWMHARGSGRVSRSSPSPPLGTVDRLAPLLYLTPRLGPDLRTSPGVPLPAKVAIRDLPGDVNDVREDVQRFDGPDVTLELVVMDHQEFVVGEESSAWTGCCASRPWGSKQSGFFSHGRMIDGPQ